MFKNNNNILKCLLLILFTVINANAQAPGGVNAGVARGWKADMYEGYFADNTKFGTGTVLTTPNVWGYTGTVVGREMVTQKSDYYAMEYNATLEVPQAGKYTFVLTGVNDKAWLWVNNTLIGSKMCCGNSVNMIVTLPAGDVPIRIKYIEYGGAEGMGIKWSGPGLTANSTIDGRFVKTDATLSHWYKADQAVFVNSGTYQYISRWNNQASSSLNQNNLRLAAGAAYTKVAGVDNLVNYNVAGNYDGDWYISQNATNSRSSNGLVYQNGTLQTYFPATFTNNASNWMWGQGWSCSANNAYGMYKTSTDISMATYGTATPTAASSAYNANETRIAEGYYNLNTGNSASSNVIRGMRVDGNTTYNTVNTLNNSGNYVDIHGIQFGAMCGSYLNTAKVPEFIYYPFKLSTLEEAKVNTYLAVKYGVTLRGIDYTATDGTIVWNRTTNATYNNRIFGIGRELATGGLNQKQSQSRMQPSGNLSNNFLKIAKGALATTNNANTGVLADGDYLLIGDNNGAMSSQTTEIPVSISGGGCTYGRLTREWKVAVTGAPGAITLVAGSNDAGSFKFSGSMAGIQVLIDEDGDGDFNTGTIRTYNYSSLSNGVATFNNVTLNNNEVFSFAWKLTSPGGVSSGLAHWVKANDGTVAGNMTSWSDQSATGANLTNNSDPSLITGALNFNPVVDFDGDDFFKATTTFPNSLTAGEVFAFGRTLTTAENRGHMYGYGGNTGGNAAHYTWSNTNVYENFGSTMRIGYTPSTGAMPEIKTGASALAFTYNALDWNLHNVYSATNNWRITVNGRSLTSSATNTVSFARPLGVASDIYVGASHGIYYFRGQIPEVILYNRVLSAIERNQVQSYLALKYGQTLHSSVTNYLASDGTTIMFDYASHWNNVFGIGRDDCSALEQKQSKSTNTGDNVTIGLNTIVTTNEANTGSFANDKMFLTIGNDAAALSATYTDIPAAYSATGCDAVRYAREWKVKNIGGVGPVQLKIGNNTFRITKSMSYLALAIDNDGDGNFATGSITLVNATRVASNAATFDNVTLPDGAVFTLCWKDAAPGGVRQPATGTTIAGQVHVNGLQYKLYTGTGADFPATLNLNPLPSMPGNLVSNGYLANLTSVELLFTEKINNAFGVEITGKIYIPTTTASWQFRSYHDDQANVKIDGVTVLNGVSWAETTGSPVSLTAGYHDIVVRFASSGTSIGWNLRWNGGSGGTYVAIPDANLFVRPLGVSAWYTATDGYFDDFNNGSNLPLTTVYPDNSSNGNDLSLFEAGVRYDKTTNLRNYNQQLNFNNSRFTLQTTYLNGFAYGKAGKSMFTVTGYGGTNALDIMLGWGSATAQKSQVIYNHNLNQLAYGGGNNGLGNDADINSYWNGTYRHNIISTSYQSDILIPGNHISLFDDRQVAPLFSERITGWNTYMAPNHQMQIGNQYNWGAGNSWVGDIDETIFYPWDLDANERLRVNSYLAIRWGITLGQSTPTNYIASDGSTIWSAATGGTFNTDITVIGRDDCGALEQLQSTSTDANDLVAMGRGALSVNNTTNTNTFANNLSFLAFANNNDNLQLNTTNMPTALPTDGCFMKLNRVWQTQPTNTPGTVQVAAGKVGLKAYSRARRPYLLISSDPVDFTGATIVEATSITNGIAYFDNITFTGVQYFTFAEVNVSPGGVSNGLTHWLSASDGTEAGNMTTWYDLSTSGVNVTASSNPELIEGALNFNPVVEFDGDDIFSVASTFTSAYTSGDVFALGKSAFLNQASGHLHTYGGNNGNGHYTYNNGGIYENFGTTDRFGYTPANGSILDAKPGITATSFNYSALDWNLHNVFSANNNWGINVKGRNLVTSATNTINFAKLDANIYIGGSNGHFFRGQIPEVFLYNRVLNATERNQVNSYLAVKYGMTLHSGVGNYLASDGTTVIYDYATHWNRITGIASDYCSNLDQRQSKSIETGALVTIGSDATNGIALTNDGNPVPVTTASARTYAVFGDNNKSVLWSGRDIPVVSEHVRLNRVWRMKETGTVGSVFIQVPDNSSPLATKLPLHLLNEPVYLLVARSTTGGVFSSASNVEEVEMTLNGTNWEVAYDFQDGDYFTFSTEKFCVGPAGMTETITSWYRTCDKPLGAIAPTTGTLLDQFNNHLLTRNGSGTATITAGSATQFNFNNHLVLTGNATLTKTGINESTITNANEGTVFSVYNETTFPFSLSKPNYNAINLGGNGGVWANGATASGGTFVAGRPNILNLNKTATQIKAGINGAGTFSANATSITVANDYAIRIGSGYNVATETYNNGRISEVITFNSSLDNADTQVLNTYLAIKYGLTLSHNYYSADYVGSNAATTTMYDISTHNNRVFGIGKDIVGCFDQRQSISAEGNLVLLSISAEIAPTNLENTGNFDAGTDQYSSDRLYVVSGDDNGAIATFNKTELPVAATDLCDYSRITREWKIRATKADLTPTVFVYDSTHPTASMKLPVIPATHKLMIIINENPDFTVNANQQEVDMVFDSTEKTWSVATFIEKNQDHYYTFAIKRKKCANDCVPSNRNIQSK